MSHIRMSYKKDDVLGFSLLRNAPKYYNFKPFCFLFLQIEDANFFVDVIVICISVHFRLKYKQKVTIFVPHLYVAKKENVFNALVCCVMRQNVTTSNIFVFSFFR